jgi:hypothetical protein
MTDAAGPVRVNRAPVLTLWASVVAERLGHPPETALSLASAVAGTAARAKARRLRLEDAREPDLLDTAPPPGGVARLLGKEVPLAHDDAGLLLADAGHGRPAPAAPVAAYLAKSFGGRLPEVRAAMQALAARYEPPELNRIGFRLYERFRPEVPDDVRGWGARGELHLDRILQAQP